MENKLAIELNKNQFSFPPEPTQYLIIDTNKPVKIDIGAGDVNQKGKPNESEGVLDTRDEWIHIDGRVGDHVEIVCDFAEIPLPDGIADEIFSGDTIEHIIPQNIDSSLREWNRITKIGGTFTGRCPNLHSTMVRYAKGEIPFQEAVNSLYGSQESIWQQHYITYTADTLKALLEKYGFGEVDLTGSPGYDKINGTPNDSWWLVWTSKKIKNV
jgi:predicted SAM-dependent methyltransferase